MQLGHKSGRRETKNLRSKNNLWYVENLVAKFLSLMLHNLVGSHNKMDVTCCCDIVGSWCTECTIASVPPSFFCWMWCHHLAPPCSWELMSESSASHWIPCPRPGAQCCRSALISFHKQCAEAAWSQYNIRPRGKLCSARIQIHPAIAGRGIM